MFVRVSTQEEAKKSAERAREDRPTGLRKSHMTTFSHSCSEAATELTLFTISSSCNKIAAHIERQLKIVKGLQGQESTTVDYTCVE